MRLRRFIGGCLERGSADLWGYLASPTAGVVECVEGFTGPEPGVWGEDDLVFSWVVNPAAFGDQLSFGLQSERFYFGSEEKGKFFSLTFEEFGQFFEPALPAILICGTEVEAWGAGVAGSLEVSFPFEVLAAIAVGDG